MAKSTKVLEKSRQFKKHIISANNNTHVWQFSRVGGVNRVNIETGKDLISLNIWTKTLDSLELPCLWNGN